MNTRKMKSVALLALAGLALVATGVAAQSSEPAAANTTRAPEAGKATVTVTYVDPESFSENKQFRNEDRYNGVEYLEPLKAYLIKRARRTLPAGDRLDVKITDIKLAGAYEPWRGPNSRYIRYMRDVYPPRINLDFTLTNASGEVIGQGSRKLRGLGYLTRSMSLPGDTDPLKYDKRLLDDWLRKGPQGL